MTDEPNLTYHSIVTLQDTRYDDWLDLYQSAFPLSEQMQISAHNRMLREIERGQAGGETSPICYLAVLDEIGQTVGLAHYLLLPECAAGALWYLAVIPEGRSRGLGSRIYQEIRRRVRAQTPNARALLFEVESPDETHSEDERHWAQRRIAFYQRNGASLLTGIRYVQSVGWQPEMAMCLMAHPYEPLTPEQTLALCKSVFGDSLEQIGPLGLE